MSAPDRETSDLVRIAQRAARRVTFAMVVKQARRQEGLTQKELATEVGVTMLSIQNIERGSPAKLATIERLSKVLGLSLCGGEWSLERDRPLPERVTKDGRWK